MCVALLVDIKCTAPQQGQPSKITTLGPLGGTHKPEVILPSLAPLVFERFFLV